MITLMSVLRQRGYGYNSIFGNVAEDICFKDTVDLCYALGYILRNNKKFDAEIPVDSSIVQQIRPNYPIQNGYTSGGNLMKRAPQLRIYFHSTVNMPLSLKARLQNDDKMRITGSLFVEACLHLGFIHGKFQDEELIKEVIAEIFVNDNEREAFFNGYSMR